jgi:hypothetical protein
MRQRHLSLSIGHHSRAPDVPGRCRDRRELFGTPHNLRGRWRRGVHLRVGDVHLFLVPGQGDTRSSGASWQCLQGLVWKVIRGLRFRGFF